MGDLFPIDHEAAPEPASLSGRFGTAQLEDPNLANALQQVTVVDGKAIEGNTTSRKYQVQPIKGTFSNSCLASTLDA
ncbi:unnamed protein product [Gadus morhua 'NCC']